MYSMNRSLITRCIDTHEIGKAFSAVAVVAALLPFLSGPAYKLLYHATLETFPGAFLVLSGAALTLACAVNVYMFTQRGRMGEVKKEADKMQVEEAQEMDKVGKLKT